MPSPMSQIDDAINIGERVAASQSPALVLCVGLLVLLAIAMWITVRRQRRWIETSLSEVRDGLRKCESSHRVCVANGHRRTSLLLQVLALAESLVSALHRTEDIKKIGDIRDEVEKLLREESDDAEREIDAAKKGRPEE